MKWCVFLSLRCFFYFILQFHSVCHVYIVQCISSHSRLHLFTYASLAIFFHWVILFLMKFILSTSFNIFNFIVSRLFFFLLLLYEKHRNERKTHSSMMWLQHGEGLSNKTMLLRERGIYSGVKTLFSHDPFMGHFLVIMNHKNFMDS